MELEVEMNKTYDELGIEQVHKDAINHMLEELREYHEPTYEHSIRVGLKARKIAGFMNLHEKPAFYGVLHDIGKRRIPLEVLGKTKGFDEEDMNIMKNHSLAGYSMLLDAGYMFSAWIALTHHRYQPNFYPETLPDLPFSLCEKTNASLRMYSRIVSIADHNDALRRKNDRFGDVEMKAEKGKEIMIQLNKDQEGLILKLYDAGILN